MKFFAPLLFCLSFVTIGFAQTVTELKHDEVIKKPLFVLKAEDKTVTIDPSKGEKINENSIESKWVEKIDILKGEEAKETYGEAGANGVVIINFKKGYRLSKEVHLLVDKTE